MSVDQRRVIDFVGVRKTDGRIILTVSDHLPFGADAQRLQVLQDKLNDYIAFVETGQLYNQYPKTDDTEVEISVVFKHTPDATALEFLRAAGETIRGAGLHFSFQTLDEDNPKHA